MITAPWQLSTLSHMPRMSANVDSYASSITVTSKHGHHLICWTFNDYSLGLVMMFIYSET